MFTMSPVSILYSDVKEQFLYLKCASSFYNRHNNGSFTIAADGNFKKRGGKTKRRPKERNS